VIKNVTLNKALYIITGLLALVAAAWGVLDPSMYVPVVSAAIIPGVFTQDLLVIAAAVVMIVLAWRMDRDGYRAAIVIWGLLGFLIYAYGIYAMEQVYTPLYPLYLAILSLSVYVLAYGLASLRPAAMEALDLPPVIRYGAAAFAVLIAVMFNVIWFGQLLPLLETGDRIEYTFSVYVIDLAFIMPGFVIAAILTLRRRALGIVGLPALFIVGVGILSPLALAELLKPVRYGLATNAGDLILFGALSVIFAALTAVYLIALKAPRTTTPA
jgi:hypothetical protein